MYDSYETSFALVLRDLNHTILINLGTSNLLSCLIDICTLYKYNKTYSLHKKQTRLKSKHREENVENIGFSYKYTY